MSRYDVLLFDADNTLFDFTRAEYLSFRRFGKLVRDWLTSDNAGSHAYTVKKLSEISDIIA